ncbi:MAG: acetate--CoA ligase family protein [Lautropia sp.]
MLGGWRGAPALDVDALLDAICSFSAWAAGAADVQSIDINPLLVRERGVIALDAAITCSSPPGQASGLPA